MSFWKGLSAPFQGLKLFGKHPSLRRNVYLPFFITLLLFVIGCAVALHTIPQLTSSIQEMVAKQVQNNLSSAYSGEMLSTVMEIASWMIKALIYILAFLVLMILIFVVSSILCSVFWELLAEEVFRIYQPQILMKRNFTNGYVKPMLRECVKQILFIVVIIASYVVAWVPFIGPLISLLIGPIVVSIWFSILICDYWMNVKDMSLKERLQFSAKNWIYLLGMGTYLILPLVGFVFYPFFIIGSAYQVTERN